MLLSEQAQSLLADVAFDPDWDARLSYQFDARGRNALIADLVAHKRLVHIGFADHQPLIEAKRKAGVWLHDLVRQSASLAVGVDINAQAVEFVRAQGVPDVHALDIHSDAMQELVSAQSPEMWLLPDVMEHLHEPIAFLTRLRLLAPQAQLTVSVPNGLSLRNVVNGFKRTERINTDHLCWYSPFTVLKTLRRAGFEPVVLRASQIAPAGSLAGQLFTRAIRRNPLWADNLVVVASPCL